MPTERCQDEFLYRWWKGVALWYNDAMYGEAMLEWEESLQHLGFQLSETSRSTKAEEEDDLKERLQEALQELSSSSKSRQPLPSSAPLLLFLAGCLLDAGAILRARQTLFSCLAAAGGRDDNQDTDHDGIRTRVLQELIASYEEDESCPDPWNSCRRIVTFAMEHHVSKRWCNPYQRPGFLYPSIAPNQKAVYTSTEQPAWCQKLQDHWREIQQEFRRLYRWTTDLSQVASHWPSVGDGSHRDGAGKHDGTVVASGDWKELVLFGAGGRPEMAPVTSKILQQIAPEAVSLALAGGGEIIFSVMAPGTVIKPHCGTTNLRLTAHLGLEVPPDRCAIRVSDTWCHWEPGKVLCFDDSFEHEVKNQSSQIRAILLLRFWHPNLPKKERSTSLELALRAKEWDRLLRFNPPVPVENKAVKDRGLEMSSCHRCLSTGYSTIRLRLDGQTFQCACGSPIA